MFVWVWTAASGGEIVELLWGKSLMSSFQKRKKERKKQTKTDILDIYMRYSKPL